MHNETNWLSQFLSDTQQQQMAEAGRAKPLDEQREHAMALQQLFADIQQQRDRDVRDPLVQALVERWDALLAPLAQGDASAEAGLNSAYAAYDTLPALADAPPELRAWAQSLRDAAAFIERARSGAGRLPGPDLHA